jgi:hypothetical protein
VLKRSESLSHGRRRRWWRPWSCLCRCGMGAWPCPVVLMLERQTRHRTTNQRPPWDHPTAKYASAPLLTFGQEERSRQAGRW